MKIFDIIVLSHAVEKQCRETLCTFNPVSSNDNILQNAQYHNQDGGIDRGKIVYIYIAESVLYVAP